MAKRNVTVVLDEESARWLRVEAARQDTSVSQYLGELVARERGRDEAYALARTRFMARKPRRLSRGDDPLPTRASLHER